MKADSFCYHFQILTFLVYICMYVCTFLYLFVKSLTYVNELNFEEVIKRYMK
jgi:hypothetical protein